jgi:hypothetical protein
MANEIKVIVGCDYTNKTNKIKFGNEVPLTSPPRRAKNNNKYVEAVFEPTGVNQAGNKYKSGILTVTSSLKVIDTSEEIDTHGYIFLQNLETAPSGSYVEFGPRIKITGSSANFETTDPAGNSVYDYSTIGSGNFSYVPVGRLEAGEVATLRMVPSGVSLAFSAGSGLSDIAATGSPSAQIKFLTFND